MNRKMFFAVTAISLAALTTSEKLSECLAAAPAESTFAAPNGITPQTPGPRKSASSIKKEPTPTPKPKPGSEEIRGRLKEVDLKKKESALTQNESEVIKEVVHRKSQKKKELAPAPTPTPQPKPDREAIKEQLKREGPKKKELITVKPRPTPTPKKA